MWILAQVNFGLVPGPITLPEVIEIKRKGGAWRGRLWSDNIKTTVWKKEKPQQLCYPTQVFIVTWRQNSEQLKMKAQSFLLTEKWYLYNKKCIYSVLRSRCDGAFLIFFILGYLFQPSTKILRLIYHHQSWIKLELCQLCTDIYAVPTFISFHLHPVSFCWRLKGTAVPLRIFCPQLLFYNCYCQNLCLLQSLRAPVCRF